MQKHDELKISLALLREAVRETPTAYGAAAKGQVAPLQARIGVLKTTCASVQNEGRYDPRLAGLTREADLLTREARTLLLAVQDRATDTRQHRSEMNQGQKVKYIRQHGSAAFMDLPT